MRSMNRILTVIALLFATPVAAEEILMDCQGSVFRYVEGFFEDSADTRVDGEWQSLGQPPSSEDWSVTKHEFKIKDRAVIAESKAVRTTGNKYYPKGTIAKIKEVADFQLFKVLVVTKYSNSEEERKREVECKKF